MFGLNICSMKTLISNLTKNCQSFTCPSKRNIMMSRVKRKTSEIYTTATKTTCSSCSTQQQHQIEKLATYSPCNLVIIGLIFALIICNGFVEGALNNVNLIIEPPAVRRFSHAVLRCTYDLEGAPLYSVKFYRGHLEFYRYTPGEYPNTKVFPFPGIHVDATCSNATQVLIRNVDFGLTGNFSCEVTADAPLFSTATAVGFLQVIELPEKRPMLFTEHTRYEPGDVLRANCSAPASRPKAELKFFINNMVINNVQTQYTRTPESLIASRISLEMQLQGIHFSSVNPSIYGHSVYGMNSVHGGSLVLRCSATIGELYQEYKEIELGTPQKDPVPARVTLSSGSTVRNFFSIFTSGKSNISSLSVYKLLLMNSMWHAYSILALIPQIVSILQIILVRYKSILNLKQHSRKVCEFLNLYFLSSR